MKDLESYTYLNGLIKPIPIAYFIDYYLQLITYFYFKNLL